MVDIKRGKVPKHDFDKKMTSLPGNDSSTPCNSLPATHVKAGVELSDNAKCKKCMHGNTNPQPVSTSETIFIENNGNTTYLETCLLSTYTLLSA